MKFYFWRNSFLYKRAKHLRAKKWNWENQTSAKRLNVDDWVLRKEKLILNMFQVKHTWNRIPIAVSVVVSEQLYDVLSRSSQTDICHGLCPSRASSQPETDPNKRDDKFTGGNTWIRSIKSIEKNVNNKTSCADYDCHRTGESKEFCRCFIIRIQWLHSAFWAIEENCLRFIEIERKRPRRCNR